MLDLPQDPQMLRGHLRDPSPHWDLDWLFQLGDAVRDAREVFADLTVVSEAGEPASRWWKTFEPAALRALGTETSTRYHFLRCPVRGPQDVRSRMLTLVTAVRLQRGGGRWSGWVTTESPDPRPGDAAARLDAQVTILRQAEADVIHHARGGIVEGLMSQLLDAGWAQRVKRRKYQERVNASALAMSARTLIDLARMTN
jgi:hypothetical protein